MIVECDVLAIFVKSYDKEDFKIYLLKVWKDLCYDHTKYFSFQGNGDTKHVEELHAALKADKLTDNEIFGSHHQYVAISQEEPTYYNSEDNVATEMIGRNHFVRFYDTMSSLHQAHLVVYDINKDFKKKIINLTPYLNKVKDFKEIKELTVFLRTIDGYDFVFLRNTRSNKQFAYNLDTHQFLTSNLRDYSYSKDELLYFGDKSSARTQMNDSTMWGYLKREGNLDELLRKSPAPKDSYLSAQLNLIIEIDSVDISKEENQINLFNDNPEVKHIYEEAVNQTHTNSNTIKKFKVLTRQGKEGDFPAGPTEPVKRKGPDKPSEPKKVPEFNIFPDSIFPVKTLSFSEILNRKSQQDYQKDYRAYEKARQKVQKDYDRDIMPIKRNGLNMSLIEIESTKPNHKSIFLLSSKQMISYIGWEQIEQIRLQFLWRTVLVLRKTFIHLLT